MKKLLASVLSIFLLVNVAPSAHAHSILISSLPKSGAALKDLPRFVSLTFNEELLVITGQHPNSIAVTSPSGKSVVAGALTVSGNSVSISLKKGRMSGKFKVAYRVVSADGHPISGQYFFSVK